LEGPIRGKSCSCSSLAVLMLTTPGIDAAAGVFPAVLAGGRSDGLAAGRASQRAALSRAAPIKEIAINERWTFFMGQLLSFATWR
jgi:hypothetical protein